MPRRTQSHGESSPGVTLDLAPNDKRVRPAIRAALQGNGRLRIAAAYVAGSPTALLGLSSARMRQLDIVCDPYSGGCEPAALDELLDAGADVRCLRHMHAKIYCGDTRAAVGSANLSTRGLKSGSLESMVTIVERDEVTRIQVWFDKVHAASERWKDIRADPLRFGSIETLWRRSQNRRETISAAQSLTLLQALSQPLMFDWTHVRFTIIADWKSSATRQAREAARISKTLVPDDCEYEFMDDPSRAEVRRARSCLAGDSVSVITLYVKTDANDIVTRVVSVHPYVGRLANVVTLGKRIFWLYDDARLPLRLSKGATKPFLQAINAGLAKRPQDVVMRDGVDYVEPEVIARLAGLLPAEAPSGSSRTGRQKRKVEQ